MSAPAQAADEQFAELMAAFDEALAAGRAEDFLARTPPPPHLAVRLQRAQDCLRRLSATWSERAENPPVRVGRFQIERELGRGGFGVVYLAFDPLLKRPVALKVPRLEALATPELRQRFLREAELTAGLDHPNIMAVYEAGQAGAVGYIASAYCPGPDLGRWLAQQPQSLSPRAAATLVRTLAEALAYCHQRGILHRDLKPSNVLLMPLAAPPDQPEGLPFVPRLTDFGLAKLMEASLTETRSSVILGTPLYMAPEQAEGRTRAVSPATDVYALGAILYELIACRPPFVGASLLEVLAQVRGQEPVPPRKVRSEVPRALETICLKCLAKEPAQRYASARALADDLRRFAAGEAIRARPPGLARRLATWACNPARIREAGIYTIVLHTALTFWTPASGVAFHLYAQLRPSQYEGNQPVSEFFQRIIFLVAAFHLPQIWLGVKTLARRRWAMWAGIIVAALTLTVALGVLLGIMDVFTDYDGDRLARWSLHSLLAVLLAVQVLLLGTALVADRNLRRQER